VTGTSKKIAGFSIPVTVIVILLLISGCGLPILTIDRLVGINNDFDPLDFNEQYLDASIDAGVLSRYVSIALDSKGRPAVIFNNRESTEVKFIEVYRYDGNQFNVSGPYTYNGTERNPFYIDSVFDTNNNLHLSFWLQDAMNTKTLHHFRVNADDSTYDQVLANTTEAFNGSSIGLFRENVRIAAAWEMASIWNLHLFKQEGAVYDMEPVDGGNFVYNIDMVIDKDDWAHLVYTITNVSTFSDFHYKKAMISDQFGSIITDEDVLIHDLPGSIEANLYNTIDLRKSDGQPAYASVYRQMTPDEAKLRFEVFNGDTFVPVNDLSADVTTDIGFTDRVSHSVMKLDGLGKAHIVFIRDNGSEKYFNYATNYNGTWEFRRLDSTDAFYQYIDVPAAIALDKFGHAHIVYWVQQGGYQYLKYATNGDFD
jgi:hypothetical protein